MPQYSVEVTPEDVQQGGSDVTNAPMALALTRRFGGVWYASEAAAYRYEPTQDTVYYPRHVDRFQKPEVVEIESSYPVPTYAEAEGGTLKTYRFVLVSFKDEFLAQASYRDANDKPVHLVAIHHSLDAVQEDILEQLRVRGVTPHASIQWITARPSGFPLYDEDALPERTDARDRLYLPTHASSNGNSPRTGSLDSVPLDVPEPVPTMDEFFADEVEKQATAETPTQAPPPGRLRRFQG